MLINGRRISTVTAPRALLRPALLVLLSERDDHGYALMERLAGVGLARVDAAAVYRCLRALEDDGSVRSWWMSAQRGAPRRMYALTTAGGQHLGRELAGLADHRDAVDALVERAKGSAPLRPSRGGPDSGDGERLLRLA